MPDDQKRREVNRREKLVGHEGERGTSTVYRTIKREGKEGYYCFMASSSLFCTPGTGACP